MNAELRDLYQDMVVDHAKNPRNFRILENASIAAEGYNPLCGDQLTLYVKIDDGVISDICFQGVGCAISKASASLMTAALKGKKREEALELFRLVHRVLTDGPATESDDRRADLGKLAVLSGVHEFPLRVKCATLAWHTLRHAIEGRRERASTE